MSKLIRIKISMMRILLNMYIAALLVAVVFYACGDNGQSEKEDSASSIGLVSAYTEISGSEVYDAIVMDLRDNENIIIISEVDHSQNASDVEMTLPMTRVVMFGNPALGTPIMQDDILAGLDLPQKILVTENKDGTVDVAYNSTMYLQDRYDLSNLEELGKVEAALSSIVSIASGTTPRLISNRNVSQYEGIIINSSPRTLDDTYNKIKQALESNPNINVMAEVDHNMNAAAAGFDLPESKLIVFGNPNLGTPLMDNRQQIGIDLPQKILVYTDGNEVKVAYNDINYLAERHNLAQMPDTIEKISTALESIIGSAIN